MHDIEKDLTVILDKDLASLEDDDWSDLAKVYKVAFAGDPWFEVSKCPAPNGQVPATSPCRAMGGFSPVEPKTRCEHCDRVPDEQAYPFPTLVPKLAQILTGCFERVTPRNPADEDADTKAGDGTVGNKVDIPDRTCVLYRELSRDRGLLIGAMFWRTSAAELVELTYADKSEELREYLCSLMPEHGSVLYLNEIFANRDLRPKGNLWNYQEMCQSAVRIAKADTLVFRTKSLALKNKTQTAFPQAVATLPTDAGFDDDRYFIVVPMKDLSLGQSPPDPEAPPASWSDQGYVEWLPADRQAEVELVDRFRRICDLHGFTPIETPGIESMDVLTARGGMDQQIFTVGRPINDRAGSGTSIGLHFDLTVPLSRYVGEHRSALKFPFRRYQHQKVWRGERLADGRFREFHQFDFDILGDGHLSRFYEVEILQLATELLSAAGVSIELRISDSRFLSALLSGTAPERARGIIGTLDHEAVGGLDHRRKTLERYELGVDAIDRILRVYEDPASLEVGREVSAGIPAATMALDALDVVIEGVRALGEAAPPVVVDLSLVRGLDYYTGLIFETTVPERRAWGSVCSGGRFDDLVTSGHPTPGVGGSIGLSRLFSLLVKDDFGSHKRQSPAPVTFIVGDWERDAAIMTKQAAELRHHGIGVEMVPMGADSLATHVTQANDRGARIVVSRASDGSASLLDQERAEQRCPVGELAAVIATALSGP